MGPKCANHCKYQARKRLRDDATVWSSCAKGETYRSSVRSWTRCVDDGEGWILEELMRGGESESLFFFEDESVLMNISSEAEGSDLHLDSVIPPFGTLCIYCQRYEVEPMDYTAARKT
ncbi:hypothetical protein VNO77_17232 [Canavalia gladiata]|uniref:Uncharacterized protein n=1 Tax=Canavalia gladiata TaxID=3824 RepID=A0AAN9LJB9_CANGL